MLLFLVKSGFKDFGRTQEGPGTLICILCTGGTFVKHSGIISAILETCSILDLINQKQFCIFVFELFCIWTGGSEGDAV